METINAFIEAAKTLQKDPIYIELEQARTENDKNEQLKKLIEEFDTARSEFGKLMSSGAEPDKARVDAMNMQVRGLYQEIMSSEGMTRYNEAKEKMDYVISHVQAIINAAMMGEDPATAQPEESSCGGSCSTCSGC